MACGTSRFRLGVGDVCQWNLGVTSDNMILSFYKEDS